MKPMLVLTVKKEGESQDVVGFYPPIQLGLALNHAKSFLEESMGSRNAVVRLELYNPAGPATARAYQVDKENLQ
jgi:hypothetical protein